MLYATYDYYQNVYCGAMSQDDFRRHVRSASAYLDQITFGRVGALQDEDPLQCKVSDACCAVAEAYRRNEEGGVTSETNGDHSVTISRDSKSDSRRLYDAAALYLGNTGLLYRGVYGCWTATKPSL